MGDGFVHLHTHTEYSMLDGAARLDDLFALAMAEGMPALAITDHGNLYGTYDFARRGRAAGVKPILGIEAYLAPGSRHERGRVRGGLRLEAGGPRESGEIDSPGVDPATGGARGEKVDKYSHMTLWAADDAGWANLVALSSLASLEGYYYKPRMDRELLERHHAGVIATTGCPGGEVSQALLRGDEALARRIAGEYAEIFGPGNFYVEIMSHGLDIERKTTPGLVQLARDLGLPLVATNDLHYTRREDAVAHEVLLCVQTGSTLADPKRFRFESEEFYLKSPAQMRALFAELPEACDATLAIAERVDAHIAEGRDLLPRFPVPEGHTEESWLRHEIGEGVRRRYGEHPSEQVLSQVEYETRVIVQMGFPSYFLVVADLVRYAKTHGIRVGPGRGSAAGSLVSYCLGITELDPLRYGLIFERFLNPERVSMPDIDLDFDERRRSDMIRYATERYGEDRVAQIVTFGTIKAKQAIKDSARVLGYPYTLGDRITKCMPSAVMGRDVSLADCFTPTSERYREATELRALAEAEPDVDRILQTARGLEGLKRQAGVHAAGVVICRDPLIEHVPIWRREADGAIITQYDMGTVESLGLLKMDFLGLRNLTVLDDCARHVEANYGTPLVLEDLPLDDPETYALLARGETIGVFQLEGGPMRSLIRGMAPNSFADVCALIALYRPGPMGEGSHLRYVERKHGRAPVTYRHPDLEAILGETYGLVVYQEQVMAIAQQMAGYTLGQADELRRAMGKKKRDVLAKEKAKFVAGFTQRGYGARLGEELFAELEPFADYAFNKSHSAGYGLVSYWTAYLKAHYPAEYMAALLTSVRDDKDKSAAYLGECRRMGLTVLPPDVNDSDADFTPKAGEIRFGLAAVRNVGSAVVASIVEARRRTGRFEDFTDFLRKVPAPVCNKKVIESLIKAGAFDSLGHARRELFERHAAAIDACLEVKRAEAAGQFSLFGDAPEPVVALDAPAGPDPGDEVREWDKTTLLAFEREMLGLYVSDHPLLGLESALAAVSEQTVSGLAGVVDGTVVTVGGILTGLVRKVTKQGNPWAMGTLEDLGGAAEVLFFPNVYSTSQQVLAQDAVLVVRARVDRREDTLRLVALEVAAPTLTAPTLTAAKSGALVVAVPSARCTPGMVERLREVLAAHPGGTPVHLKLVGPARTTILKIQDGLRVAPCSSLMGDLKELLGPGCLALAP